jgi:hypothetical protein
VIEVHAKGKAAKDYDENVERYARLGIAEYFIFDRTRLSLRGFRLPPPEPGRKARSYRPILPQQGVYASQVLGLDLVVDGEKLRFLLGMAPVPEMDELVIKLGSLLNEVIAQKEEAERLAAAEAERAEAERAAKDEALRRVAELEARLAAVERKT